MMRYNRLEHQFVEHVPERLESGVLYISMKYATAIHYCCCGCGEEVVTPFTPTDWRMIFDGETVSLCPSIGNWNFACRSHYFIQDGQIVEVGPWTDQQVESNRLEDKAAKTSYYSTPELTAATKTTQNTTASQKTSKVYQSFVGRCMRAIKMFLRHLT